MQKKNCVFLFLLKEEDRLIALVQSGQKAGGEKGRQSLSGDYVFIMFYYWCKKKEEEEEEREIKKLKAVISILTCTYPF